jgi:hypothetical protein
MSNPGPLQVATLSQPFGRWVVSATSAPAISGAGSHSASGMRSSAAHIAELRGTETVKVAPRFHRRRSRSTR